MLDFDYRPSCIDCGNSKLVFAADHVSCMACGLEVPNCKACNTSTMSLALTADYKKIKQLEVGKRIQCELTCNHCIKITGQVHYPTIVKRNKPHDKCYACKLDYAFCSDGGLCFSCDEIRSGFY